MQLNDFLNQTVEREEGPHPFTLESSRMLEARVEGRVWTKMGAMVAYTGDLRFVRQGILQGGMIKALKRAVTSEIGPLVSVEGEGLVYLADRARQVTVIDLYGEALNVGGNDLLAFQDSLEHDITMHRRVAGWASGGLFSVRLGGHGAVAILSHGDPLTLPVWPGRRVVTDPGATIAWSASLTPQLSVDMSLRNMIGRGAGETLKMVFEGEGFVVVQPYEETPAPSGQR